MTSSAVQDRLADQAAEDAFRREEAGAIAQCAVLACTQPIKARREAVGYCADHLPPLVDAEGRPTKDGWRTIGDRLRMEMPAKERDGRGGKRFKYITARQVMDRLDAVVGPGNWANSFRVLDLPTSVVECTLTVFGVSKSDVGFPNNPEHPEDEALKSAYSDALKRAAVHHGVGRFLYGDT